MNDVTKLYLALDGIEWGSYDPSGALKARTIRANGAGDVVAAINSPAADVICLLSSPVFGRLR